MKVALNPHITEKTYRLLGTAGEAGSQYTFKVPVKLRKETIKKVLEREYKVHVVSINTVNLPGKARRFKGINGSTSATKKAIVRLRLGERIAAFEVEKAQEDK